MSTREERVWEWSVAVEAVLRRNGVTDDGLAVATAEFLAGQDELLDYPNPVLSDDHLLLITRAIAWERDVR